MKLKILGHDQEYNFDEGAELSKVLDASNSPLLFGCRTGICGTCLVRVEEGSERDLTPGDDEAEFLEIVDEGEGRLRLACQMKLSNDLVLKYIGKK